MMLQQVAGGDGPGPGWGNRPPGNFMPRGGGPMMGGRGIPPMRGGGPPMMRGMGAPMMRGGVPPMGSPFQQRAMLMQQQQGGFPRGGNMGGPFQPRYVLRIIKYL